MTSIMNSYLILLITAIIICHTSAKNPNIKYPNCENDKGEEVTEGNDYIPPDDHCIHCMCFKGQGKFCGAIRCDDPPPLECKNWTEYCCNYTCHDDEYNEFDHFDVNGGYDSPENTPFSRFKKYAGQLWDRLIYGRKKQETEEFDYQSDENATENQQNTSASNLQSTTISDIPYDIPSPSLDEIPSKLTTDVNDAEHVSDEKLYDLHSLRNCRDLNDIEVEEGQFYVPGPAKCSVCRCINRRARFCRNMECQTKPPKDCKDWTEDCCEYTCNDYIDPKSNFFINRWFDHWFSRTTMPPPDDPFYESPM